MRHATRICDSLPLSGDSVPPTRGISACQRLLEGDGDLLRLAPNAWRNLYSGAYFDLQKSWTRLCPRFLERKSELKFFAELQCTAITCRQSQFSPFRHSDPALSPSGCVFLIVYHNVDKVLGVTVCDHCQRTERHQ